MKFSIKLLLCTMIVMAIAFGFSGFYFVNYVFETALDREVGQALDENSILRFAFETAALNVPAKYDVLQDHTIEQIASNMETGGHDSSRLLRLSDEEKNVLYISSGFEADNGLLGQTDENTKTYRVIRQEDSYYIQTGITVNALDRILYLETLKDVSEVFRERQLGFSVYRRVTIHPPGDDAGIRYGADAGDFLLADQAHPPAYQGDEADGGGRLWLSGKADQQ